MGKKWRFLTNHALVLIHVANNPKSTLREIAAAVGITERAVQSVLGDLRQERLISQKKFGRRNQYWLNYNVLLSYPLQGPYRTVVELARAVSDLGGQLGGDDDDDPDAPAPGPR